MVDRVMKKRLSGSGRHRPSNKLEIAIGSQIRAFRKKMDLTIAELASLANLSTGMLSKIENGNTSPFLSTMQSLSDALNIPVTAIFRKPEDSLFFDLEIVECTDPTKEEPCARSLDFSINTPPAMASTCPPARH